MIQRIMRMSPVHKALSIQRGLRGVLQGRMAAKTKCLADNNKRRSSAKPTNNHSVPRSVPHSVVQIGAASAPIARRKAQARSHLFPPLTVALGARSDGSPSYGLDVVALAFAVVLAAALVFLISHLMPLLADVMPQVLSVNPG